MNHLKTEEKIECLKNLLADPDDWMSRRILELADEEDETEETNSPLGINETSPVALKRRLKSK